MTLGAEMRALWRARWLTCVREIADIREQRATWLNPENSNPHYSFVECMCSYFDDLRLDDGADGYAARLAEGMVTLQEGAVVARLHAMLSAYCSDGPNEYDHDAILGDPACLAVTEEAQSTIMRLRGLLTEPEELKTLSEASAEALRSSRSLGNS